MFNVARRNLSNLWWFWIVGLFAFLWVIVRSGTNPKRLTYPCQQAAFPLASAWLTALIALLGGALIWKRFAKLSALGAVMVVLVFFAVPPVNAVTRGMIPSALPTWEVENPVSTVFVMDSLPPTSGSLSAGDSSVPEEYLSDPAMDTMLAMLDAKGVHLYKTTEHSDGIVGADNIVIIKGNFQWNARNTTSADRIKGLIWKILKHPSGFTGEIVVCDNTQDIGTGINQNDNNSEDTAQSLLDVVATFKAKGYPVCALDWKNMWDDVATEYSDGNYADGYVYDAETKITYPKFRTPSGEHYVSLRSGVWDTLSETYDSSKLCIIDFPVLKAHAMAGATIAVKNWIGVLTTAYSQQRFGGFMPMHSNYFFSKYALVAKVMAVTFPRLVFIDASWTTTQGPNNPSAVVKTNMLLASTDPAASSWYAAKFILTPVAANPNATNPDLEGGTYHNVLQNWTTFLRDSAGFACTTDSAEIAVYDRSVLPPPSVGEARTLHEGLMLDAKPLEFGHWAIEYTLPQSGSTRILILDTSGRSVKLLVDEVKAAGSFSVFWDGRDGQGREVSAGTYLVSIESGVSRLTQKILKLK